MSIKPEHIHIERLQDGSYQLSWEFIEPTEISIHAGHTPDDINLDTVLIQTDEKTAIVPGLPTHQRHYFQLQTATGESYLAGERRLPLPNVQNFRDIGGYRTADGKQVRWGKLYRSGHLADLTDAERNYLHRLDIELVVDFRMVDEREKYPTRLDGPNAPDIHLMNVWPGSATGFQAKIAEGNMSIEMVADFMCSINRDLVAEHTARFAEMFELLLQYNKPALVHCTAGKDRTGFACALVLLSLGVPMEVAMRDYLLSNQYYDASHRAAERNAERQARDEAPLDPELSQHLSKVQKEYLLTAFGVIEREYQTIENYLTDGLGLTDEKRQALKAKMLI